MTSRLALLGALLVGGCSCEGADGLDTLAPELALDAERIDFGEVTVGDIRVKALRIENKGGLALQIQSITLGAAGELAIATAIPEAIAPRDKLELALSFAPLDVGPEDAILVITTDAGERSVPLHGVGVNGGVAVTPIGEPCEGVTGSLSFGDVALNQTVDREIEVDNDGTGAFDILGTELEGGTTGEFTVEQVMMTLAPQASRALRVSYTPIDGGRDIGAILIRTNVPGKELQRVPVCGQGVGPALCARPLPLDFGTVALGTTQARMLRLESCGLVPLELASARLSSDAAHPTSALFSMPSLSARTLAPGDAVDVEVTFDARTAGAASGFVDVQSNGGATFVPINAVAALGCDLSVAPARLTYSGVAPGSTQTKSVVVLNQGASICSLSRLEITLGGPKFALQAAPALPLVIPAGGTETVAITYAPTSATNDLGTLEIEESGVTKQVELVGDQMPPAGCQLDVRPAVLAHGIVALGSQRDLSVEVVNVSRSVCIFRGASITMGSSEFAVLNAPAIAAIPSSTPLVLTVRYRPTVAGAAQGNLQIRSNGPQLDVPLFGSAAQPAICVQPQRLVFGTLPVGTRATRDFHITACGGSNVVIASMAFAPGTTGEYVLVSAPALPLPLAAGASQTITMAYTPANVGVDTAVLTLATDQPSDPTVDVIATGEGVIPATESVYLHTLTELFAYDPAANATRRIGAFPLLVGMTDIAIDLMGAMYGVDGNGAIYRVDPLTAATTHLFDATAGSVGLTCLSDGKLVVAGAGVELWDPSTQTLDRTIVPAGRFQTSGDIIALPDGFLYWSVNAGADFLVRVDPMTGATTSLPQLGVQNIWGLGYADMQLFAFASSGVALVVDSSTGMPISPRSVPGEWFGATTNPVLW